MPAEIKSLVKDGNSEHLSVDEAFAESGVSSWEELSTDSISELIETTGPRQALKLLVALINEVPAADKEKIDRIKLMDKLISTTRSMMETHQKHEEAVVMNRRITEIETRVRELERDCGNGAQFLQETWDRDRIDG
jgi:hypothetical protein